MQNQEKRQQYEDQGYALFPGTLDRGLMEETVRHVDWLMEHYPDIKPELLTTDRIVDDPFWLRLVSDHRLLDIAEQFLGPDIALFGAHYFCKMPFVGRAVLWHQDGSYWPLEPIEVVTLWLAVDEATPENGCLRVIPGTHKIQLQEMQANTQVSNILESEVDPALVDESKLVNIVLQPGDVEVHHPNIFHSSEANLSPKRRCGMAIRYISARSRILYENWPTYLLRGQAVPGVNDYRPMPQYVEGKHMPFAGAAEFGRS